MVHLDRLHQEPTMFLARFINDCGQIIALFKTCDTFCQQVMLTFYLYLCVYIYIYIYIYIYTISHAYFLFLLMYTLLIYIFCQQDMFCGQVRCTLSLSDCLIV